MVSPCNLGHTQTAVVLDAEPRTTALVPLWTAKEAVAANLVINGPSGHQQLLWTNYSKADDASMASYFSDISLWVSAVPNGTTTGVLREHAVRMSYTVKCDHDVPILDTCPGRILLLRTFNEHLRFRSHGWR